VAGVRGLPAVWAVSRVAVRTRPAAYMRSRRQCYCWVQRNWLADNGWV